MSEQDTGLGTERAFIKGVELSASFYNEAVSPILNKHFSGIRYSAALLGPGSDVLGFDTPKSRDHDWGPRLILFLDEADSIAERRYCINADDLQRRRELASRTTLHSGRDALSLRSVHALGDDIDYVLRRELPHEFRGYPTNFSCDADGNSSMWRTHGGEVNHGVTIQTIYSFFRQYLNYDPSEELRVTDWLTFPEHFLCGIVGGRVFHDGLGQLEPLRAKLQYYPHDVWLYLLANQWQKLWSPEQAMMGRCAQTGDELGSRLVAVRMVRNLMRLCFLMERQYAPYAKWFGLAFRKLVCAERLTPLFLQILNAANWQEREGFLLSAFEIVAERQNALALTDPLPIRIARYASRPSTTLNSDAFSGALRARITSHEILSLPQNLGSIDQIVSDDAVWVLSFPEQFGKLKSMYA